jgi:hypothetical protein
VNVPIRTTVLALLIGMLAGCSTKDLARFKAQLDRSQCNQWTPTMAIATTPPAPFDAAAVPAEVKAHFSPNSLHIAHAINVLPLLDDYMAHMQVPSTERSLEQRIQLLELRRTIAYHCDLASLEISAVASELDCEEEKVSQMARHMEEVEARTQSRLNVAAIVVGAMGAVITGIHLSQDDNSDVDALGIGFGVAEAALGTAMLLSRERTEYTHRRNALRIIHEGTDPQGLFPASIWYCLVNPVPGAPADRTLRTELLNRWREEGATVGDEASLYLGDGGTYSTEQLHTRASMYDQLESTIKLVKQDLLQLVQELDTQDP